MLVSRDVRVDEQSFMNQHYSSWTVQKYETSIFDPCEIIHHNLGLHHTGNHTKNPWRVISLTHLRPYQQFLRSQIVKFNPVLQLMFHFHHSQSHPCYNLLNLLYQVCHNNHLHQIFLSHQIPYHLQNPYLRNHI